MSEGKGAWPTLQPRKQWRFSVAQLLALLTLSAIPLGLVGQRMTDARRQRAAASAITAAGGTVVYEVGSRPDHWAARWFGLDFAADVWKVDFGDPRIVRLMATKSSHPGHEQFVIEGEPREATGDVLRHVGKLTELRWLWLDDLPASDEDLAQLRGLPTLFWIVAKTAISDSGVAHFATLPRLTMLDLRGRGITDEGARALSACQRLHWLKLHGTSITDEGLAAISRCASLGELRLPGAAISDAGLPHLARLPALRTLDLSGTQIGDAGVAHLQLVPQLSSLDLSGTRITDRGRIALAAVGLHSLLLNDTSVGSERLPAAIPQKSLRQLSLAGTRIDDEGWESTLADYPSLQYLDISRTVISDASVPLLAEHHKLEQLNVSRTAVSRAGIETLCRRGRLRTLWILRGQLTDQEAESLRTRYPKLAVEWIH
ncbi:MAG: hypothetical protein U0836_24280 [Pirellulales bacterium]